MSLRVWFIGDDAVFRAQAQACVCHFGESRMKLLSSRDGLRALQTEAAPDAVCFSYCRANLEVLRSVGYTGRLCCVVSAGDIRAIAECRAAGIYEIFTTESTLFDFIPSFAQKSVTCSGAVGAGELLEWLGMSPSLVGFRYWKQILEGPRKFLTAWYRELAAAYGVSEHTVQKRMAYALERAFTACDCRDGWFALMDSYSNVVPTEKDFYLAATGFLYPEQKDCENFNK